MWTKIEVFIMERRLKQHFDFDNDI